MGEVVDYEIPHTGKISTSVGGQKTSFMPCKVFIFHFLFCFIIVFLFVCYCFCEKQLSCFCFFGANQASYYGGNDRARNLLSDALENDFLVANRATLRPFEVLGSHSTIFF